MLRISYYHKFKSAWKTRSIPHFQPTGTFTCPRRYHKHSLQNSTDVSTHSYVVCHTA